MKYARIIGSGSYLPAKIMTNSDFESIVETSDEWIFERTGIKERHLIDNDQTVEEMAYEASLRALEAAGISANKLDMIIVATCTATHRIPSSACLLQKRLSITGCSAFDLNAACSGFVYGLSVAEQFIRTGSCKNILVVGNDALTRVIDWQDRSTCILFGDGSGAVVVTADQHPGIISSKMYADGEHDYLLYTENNPHEKGDSYIRMQGRELFKIAVPTLTKIIQNIMTENNLLPEDIDWIVPHQANYRILQAAAKMLAFPLEKFVLTLEKQGNTSAASLPLAFDTAIRSGQIKQGQTIILEAFGGGLTWGGVLLKL